MSALEVMAPGGETIDSYENLTPYEVVALMQQVAAPGQTELDPFTTQTLVELTNKLIETNGDRAVAEYDRYVNVQERALELPDKELREHLQGKTILVTGGTGLIGSILMEQITHYNPNRIVSISRGITTPHAVVTGAEYLSADIRDKARLAEVVSDVKPDIIYHVAADKYNHEAETRIRHTLTTNVNGVQNVIEVAEAADVPQIVYASTGKATRPYSPDIYASSKKSGELLMAQAAAKNKLLCSAVRFTHVVDDSNIRRKIDEWIDAEAPVMLQGPDVWMYVQSAQESAQLLLNATLEAQPGVLRVQAIRNLGLPINLAELGLGAIAKRGAKVPIYFQGTIQGYEEKAWPHLYGMESGDCSPLMNAIETEELSVSATCPQIDTFPLEIDDSADLNQKLVAVQAACETGEPCDVVRSKNHELSWVMLEARLAMVPLTVLQRICRRIQKSEGLEELNDEHRTTNQAFINALAAREQAA